MRIKLFNNWFHISVQSPLIVVREKKWTLNKKDTLSFLNTYWSFTPTNKQYEYLVRNNIISYYSRLRDYLMNELGRECAWRKN